MPSTATDPRTGVPRQVFPTLREDDIHRAVHSARLSAAGWAALTTGERSRRLLRLAAAVEDDAAAYVRSECAGTGKPRSEAEGEIANCVDLLRFYAGVVRGDLSPASGHRIPGRESWVRWEPLGVVGVVVPWNYPLMMAIWRLAPALAAGNAVVLKPAETTPDSVLLLAEHAAEVLGPDVLTVTPGDRETGRLLVASDVDAIAFTGSLQGGLDVHARAGVRRVSLELGGNCPAIVLPDAPAHTYEDLVAACTYNAGQSCAAPARVITLAENFDSTVSALAEAMRGRRAGADFGPLNNPDQLARYDSILNASKAAIREQGDVVVAPDERGGYWRPGVVLADLPDDDPAVTEEIFGPVLTVQAADSPEHAVRMANDVPQALAASVWGDSVSGLLGISRELQAGEVWVNCHLEQTADLPHGGRKQSGSGTDLSVLALTEYQRPKTVTVRIA
ncbi:Acyl-CoA reductase [Lentzea fradiae]|uniref:Acyl-CoA reductase n=1 Tax=Lentzea fradiae TaxID=200378 RepID=A0A1G7VIV1_9PSEU|nr:aldehyde dehydrogenase family protein [Lentzea fradiae]SDG59746.1 Acyl-CoA reductase [Lentzea fradiae]